MIKLFYSVYGIKNEETTLIIKLCEYVSQKELIHLWLGNITQNENATPIWKLEFKELCIWTRKNFQKKPPSIMAKTPKTFLFRLLLFISIQKITNKQLNN